jgi:hypothetical protein
MSEFQSEWVRELRFHVRRADAVVGPIGRAELEQGISSGKFHEEMPASVDMGSTWHPLRVHLGLPDPAPTNLRASLENGSAPVEQLESLEPISAVPEPKPGFIIRQWDKLIALLVGFAQGFLPVTIPLAGGFGYLVVAQDAKRSKHLNTMANFANQQKDAIEPGDIERALDPGIWQGSSRPYVAIDGLVEAQRQARERIQPEMILNLKAADAPPDKAYLQAQRAAGKEWVRSDQADLLIASGHQIRSSVSPAEQVEDLKKEPGIKFIHRKAVEKSVQKSWDLARKNQLDLIAGQKKKMAEGSLALSRVVGALRDPVVKKLYPSLDALCENPPALADLPEALARVIAAGQNQRINP